MGDTRTPLYYTFGNHMHWVDMQWLWGYDVLPGCVSDMLHLIEETGARGNVNFDGIGYEKMAAECPEALAQLRDAVARGDVEPVGCSYGQPYGLFHGGESNIRQFTHGVRSVRRLLGVRPKTFWEEEFYFFPQLPQLLRQCGYTGASLFFQWTWHTPEVPKEPHSLILWEGLDGTRIPTLPRNDLNVHQWPEDFDGLLDGPLINEREVQWGPPVISQWLELMPTRNWMCRSELLLPRLKELMADERFEMRARTCSELIEELQQASEQSPKRKLGVASAGADTVADFPVRRYTMDDVWHGMTLGKLADRHPRTSRQTELLILSAESYSAVASLFGRPYPSWDVYPTWEIDEAWRELLAAQHHDNHECESLCGFVGYHQMEKAERHANEVAHRAKGHLQDRSAGPITGNPLGWNERFRIGEAGESSVTIPSFGFALFSDGDGLPAKVTFEKSDEVIRLTRGDLSVEIDLKKGGIRQISTREFPQGVLSDRGAFIDLNMWCEGEHVTWEDGHCVFTDEDRGRVELSFSNLAVTIFLAQTVDAVDIMWSLDNEELFPDHGLCSALAASVSTSFELASIRTDSPHGSHAVEGASEGKRKYPEGDWMTSPQWFEEVDEAVHSLSWLDLLDDDGAGLLICNNGTQQWFKEESGVEGVLLSNDPWDGRRTEMGFARPVCMRLYPHGMINDSVRTKTAQEFSLDDNALVHLNSRLDNPGFGIGGGELPEAPDLPPVFGPLEIENAPNVLAHAFFRESMKSGEHLPEWAGHRMFAASDGACDHPFAVRLVEWHGEDAHVSLTLAGDVAMAAKANVMGETGAWSAGDAPADVPAHLEDTGWLNVESNVEPPAWAIVGGKPIESKGEPIRWSRVRFHMRPREIATIMADMVMGRKEWRDLDAKREVWARIHKGKAQAHEGAQGRRQDGRDGG